MILSDDGKNTRMRPLKIQLELDGEAVPFDRSCRHYKFRKKLLLHKTLTSDLTDITQPMKVLGELHVM